MIELKDVSKYFGGVAVLRSVTTTFYDGEIHGLVGENGAGKSTLMKILSGVYKNEQGSIYMDSEEISINNTMDAYQLGIRIVHQELSLIRSLTVAENLFIHHMRRARPTKFLNRNDLAAEAKKLLDEWEIDVEPDKLVSEVPIGTMQLIEIARELSTGGKVFILDEPTSSLTEKEIDRLFKILRSLKAKGYVIIFISHRLNEMQELADRVTLLRNGEMIAASETKNMSNDEMVRLIADKDADELYPKFPAVFGGIACEAEHLNNWCLRDVSINVRWGEIVGIAGLVGAGRSETLRCLFGIDVYDEKGQIRIDGKNVKIRKPIQAMKNGIAFLSEDRANEGIIPTMSVAKNMVLMNIKRIRTNGFLSTEKIRKLAQMMIEKLNIVTANAEHQAISQLSGGNQQKVLFGRLLALEPKILLVDEPTRGVDVSNKTEIYKVLGSFVQSGGAVIMVSSELEELIGICDRIIVLCAGRMAGEFERSDFNKEEILRCMMGLQAVL